MENGAGVMWGWSVFRVFYRAVGYLSSTMVEASDEAAARAIVAGRPDCVAVTSVQLVRVIRAEVAR